jgi:DNA-binding transcriptional LysR family regulator
VPDDLDLRKLRYFVAVAAELHFGRAAAALHIAQPVLSRQIRALEVELDAELFVRDRRRTELTPAGEELLAEARPLLAAAAAARRRVARATAPQATFTVGFMPGLIVTTAVRELSRRRPDLAVDVRRTGWDDQVAVVHDGRVDVSLVRPPVDRDGLVVRPLLTEPRLAVLPVEHRLAHKDAVDLADLAGEHLLQDPGALPEWREASRDAAGSPPIRTVEEKLEHVAAGHGFVVLPRSTADFYRRPDVRAVPVADIGPGEVCLAWRSARTTDEIREFADLAETHRATLVGDRPDV